jgi:hypothetical protein
VIDRTRDGRELSTARNPGWRRPAATATLPGKTTVEHDAQSGLVALHHGDTVRLFDQCDLVTVGALALHCAAAGRTVTPELIWTILGQQIEPDRGQDP